MKQYKSMRGVNIDLAKLMAKAEKSIAVGNTQTNARGDQLGRGGRVVKSADEIARDHYNANNPKAVVKSSIKVDNTLDASSKKEEPAKQEVDDWEEPVAETMTEQEEYANAGVTKEQAEKTVEETTDDPWVDSIVVSVSVFTLTSSSTFISGSTQSSVFCLTGSFFTSSFLPDVSSVLSTFIVDFTTAFGLFTL